MKAVRTIRTTVRLSPQEHQALKERATDCGRQISTFMRESALGAIPRQRQPRIEREAVHQLARVGNNLNQLARAANTTGRAELSRRLDEVLQEVLEAIADLRP